MCCNRLTIRSRSSNFASITGRAAAAVTGAPNIFAPDPSTITAPGINLCSFSALLCLCCVQLVSGRRISHFAELT